jgi:hypothetical protein
MNPFDDDDDEQGLDDGGEDSTAALVWQLLLLINPGDEETALQQFTAYREAADAADAGALEPIALVGRVIDWHSGFQVDADDPRALVQALDELSARWNLTIDWGGEVDDEEFFDDTDVPALLGVAYDRLAEFGYTVWAWETDGDSYAGWITLTGDSEPLREVATALGINLRLASEVT